MAEHLTVRQADEFNEAYLRPILDQIYDHLGYKVVRYSDKNLQYRGLDATLKKDGVSIKVDEKFDTTRTLHIYDHDMGPERDTATTFCMELNRLQRNGVRANGWFHPEVREDALNTHYIFGWSNNDKDTPARNGKLTKVKQIEVCLISHDAIVNIIENAYNGSVDYDGIIKAALTQARGQEDEQVSLERVGDTHVVYSGKLKEKPVNIIIKKSALRQAAEWSWAFNCEGEGGNEIITESRKMRFTPGDVWHQIKDYFEPIVA